MGKAGKRHHTPPELDRFFERGQIDEDSYGQFWEDWWDASPGERRKIKEQLVLDYEQGEEVEKEPEKQLHLVTRSKSEAERRARKLGGYVARRDRHGRFNKRGHFYQAISRKKKG